MTAKYKCGNEVRVNDIVKCIEDPYLTPYAGRKDAFYRVVWVRGGAYGNARDLRLDGADENSPSSDSFRFVLVQRDGKKAPSPAMPPLKAGDVVRESLDLSRRYIVKNCWIDEKVDWRIDVVGESRGVPVRGSELASQYETMPPQTTPPKFKVGDVVRVRGGRPEWKVCKVHDIGQQWQYSLTFLQSPEQGGCGLYLESSLSPCGEADSLQDFCATIGVSDAKTRNIYHFVETKMLQPLRDKLAQIKEIA